MLNHVRQAFDDLNTCLNQFINDEENFQRICDLGEAMADAFSNGKKVLIAGNGGSHCDALHFAEEFTGRFRKERKALPAIALGDGAHITCTANDYGFEYIFSRMVEAYGQEGDIFIGLSTSGNSENIIKAMESSEASKVTTVGLLGKNGGKLKGRCDYEWIVPGQTSDRIQEIHMAILHILIEVVERKLFPENYEG